MPAEWAARLDFSTLVPVSEAHPTQDWRLRYNDCVWRLRWRGSGRWLFIYLMLEFQRSHEHFMAVRIMSYEGVLYEHLLKALALQS
ncbi:MAG: Rpn family recombination-promoting nuclease/putative transposase, partial [bacterium]|nr:Rpn family recombination-promoting nuclease/putative transposase [bacterium]